MFDLATYNSKSEYYKIPWGAVPAESSVSFILRPLRSAGFSRGRLTAFFEEEEHTLEIPMSWTGSSLGRDKFSCTMSVGNYVGLVWYHFVLEGLDGRKEESEVYQLTVYDDKETVPTWFGEGFTYQIFPDRFCRLAIPDPTGMVGGRMVHHEWGEEPEFRPDCKGEIRNRDFFGGSLAGVISKLDYLQSLGVETLYFNPIFEGAENHRYGTGDYEKIDPMLGSNANFSDLCSQAHRRGIRVILDGVFNHVGYVSKYFNGTGEYGEGGAARSQQSPYYPWFSFHHWPDRYDAWWGIYSLPAVEESRPDYVDYITGRDGIVRRWLRAGADGWRLDVADELPDSFVRALHQAVRAEKVDGMVIGEVWEDGSNKIAYGKRRKHILGGHCDGLMNYPLRNALLSWLMGGDGRRFYEDMETIRENYPPFAFYSAMNSLGTHDTPRILTLLGSGGVGGEGSKEEKAKSLLSPEQRHLGLARLRLGLLVLFGFPGSPTVYYGDEVGMEGWEDPFNRRTYPWGNEDTDLRDYVAALGKLRKDYPPLRRGDVHYVVAKGPLLAFTRSLEGCTLLIGANNSSVPASFSLTARHHPSFLMGEGCCRPALGKGRYIFTLPPMGGVMVEL